MRYNALYRSAFIAHIHIQNQEMVAISNRIKKGLLKKIGKGLEMKASALKQINNRMIDKIE
jgi:hypothetical protein